MRSVDWAQNISEKSGHEGGQDRERDGVDTGHAVKLLESPALNLRISATPRFKPLTHSICFKIPKNPM